MENTARHKITSDLRQSPEYANYMRSIGWQVFGENPQAFIRKLGVLGAIAKVQRVELPLSSDFIREINQQRVWMIKLEPNKQGVLPPRFRQDTWPMLATKTLRVDLTKPEKDVINQFKKDCRYSLRKAQQVNPTIKINDFELFYAIWKRASGIKKLWIPSKKEFDALVHAFGKNCYCITAGDLAGSLVLVHSHTAYYYYSGAVPEGKQQNLPYLIIWECMKEAKKRKCTTWDFEGIYDERFPNKGWWGFSHFKRSFGGYEVDFPGSYIKWF